MRNNRRYVCGEISAKRLIDVPQGSAFYEAVPQIRKRYMTALCCAPFHFYEENLRVDKRPPRCANDLFLGFADKSPGDSPPACQNLPAFRKQAQAVPLALALPLLLGGRGRGAGARKRRLRRHRAGLCARPPILWRITSPFMNRTFGENAALACLLRSLPRLPGPVAEMPHKPLTRKAGMNAAAKYRCLQSWLQMICAQGRFGSRYHKEPVFLRLLPKNQAAACHCGYIIHNTLNRSYICAAADLWHSWSWFRIPRNIKP